MPKFKYESIDKAGKVSSGTVEAADRQVAARVLQDQGLFPTSIFSENERESPKNEKKKDETVRLLNRKINLPFPGRSAVSEQERAVLFRQWSSLISSGLPLVRSLSCLIDQQENESIKAAITDIREKIQSGGMLADAMAAHRDVFSELQINMIRAGEMGGILETSLERLAVFTEAEQDLRSRVISAMLYPAILTGVMVVAIGFLLTFVVPRFVGLFRDMQQTLPMPTLILIAMGNFMSRFWWVVVILPLAAGFGIKNYAETKEGRLRMDRFKLRIPLFGSLVRKVVISRFTRTLSTLVEGGIPILSALNIARETAGNAVFIKALESVQSSVREGTNLAEPLRQAKEFPPLVIHMVAVGEESGRLGEMLLRVAEVYDGEISANIKRLTGLLEPLIILVMSVVVAFVVLAIVLPILSLDVVSS